MTLKELEREVLALIFESAIEDRDAFISAVRRALPKIASERAIRTRAVFSKTKDRLSAFLPYFHKPLGESFSYTAEGVAFSLTVSGDGVLTLRDGEREISYAFSGNREKLRGFISSGSGTLEFPKDCACEIFSLAVFTETAGGSESDIDFITEYKEYDIKAENKRFLAFLEPPKDGSGRVIKGAYTRGSVAYIPRDYVGTVCIEYKRLPETVSYGDVDRALDVTEECEHLLGLLVASYMLLDGNEALSEYYASLYREGMAAVKLYNREGTDSRYDDVTGWA